MSAGDYLEEMRMIQPSGPHDPNGRDTLELSIRQRKEVDPKWTYYLPPFVADQAAGPTN